MEKLPIFISLEHRKILIVGGGNAALIKIKTFFIVKKIIPYFKSVLNKNHKHQEPAVTITGI